MLKIRARVPMAAALLLGLAVAGVTLYASSNKKKDKTDSSAAGMAESKRALHALQRLTFGPRPGEAERVAAMGVEQWMDQQLHPDRIDDGNLEARLAPLRTLRMDTKEIVETFPPQPVIKAVMEGKRPMPSDPAKRVVYEAQIEKLQEKREMKQEAAATAAAAPAPAGPAAQGTNAAASDAGGGDAAANANDTATNTASGNPTANP